MVIMRTLVSVKEVKLYSSLTRFTDPQMFINDGFIKPNFTLKLSFVNTITKDKFKITTQSIYGLIKGLETAVSWFYDENMKDLFFIDDDVLQFNYDYAKLCVSITSPDNEHIEIRPVVDYTETDRGRESIVMYINSTASQTVMTRAQFESFYVALKEFSFQTEAMLLLYEHDRQMELYLANGGTIDERKDQG
jgi:hypothetical protein